MTNFYFIEQLCLRDMQYSIRSGNDESSNDLNSSCPKNNSYRDREKKSGKFLMDNFFTYL